MTTRLAALTLAACLATGCATVDMTEMAMPVAKSEAPAEKNVVQRAAAKLYNAFRSKGFVAKTSRKRVQSAASVLLNGLEDRDLADAGVDYASQELPPAVVSADIVFATQHIRQTTRAAEVYLEIADADRSVRDEMNDLEQALLASREAQTSFAKLVAPTDADFASLSVEIDALKAVTDRFGQRVRRDMAADMAARRKASS